MSVTELQVIDAAIEQLSKRGGYTPNGYIVDKETGYESGPGQRVATCAVGGVEQAVWRLTGKDPGHVVNPHGNRRDLYARVIRKLNVKAKKMYPACNDVEDVTLGATARTTRPKVLAVFNAVKDDLS